MATVVIRGRFNKPAILRALGAGTVWGLVLSAGFTAMMVASCDPVCLDGIAAMTATNIAVGAAVIGPLAAIAPTAQE